MGDKTMKLFETLLQMQHKRESRTSLWPHCKLNKYYFKFRSKKRKKDSMKYELRMK